MRRPRRPAYSVLRSEQDAPRLPHWREGLRACLWGGSHRDRPGLSVSGRARPASPAEPGFIGSHFVAPPPARGPVTRSSCSTCSPTPASPDNLADVEHDFHRGDIADPAAVERAAAGCAAIVNFAAETHVDRSILDGGDVLTTNVTGTNVLLDARPLRGKDPAFRACLDRRGLRRRARLGRARRSEDDGLRPSSPYSAATASGDLFVLAHVRTYDLDALVTRGSNTYGPRQYPEKFLPLFITNALDGQHLPVYGDGRQRREWLHVEDHCAGIDLALRRGSAGEVYNLGGGEEVENLEITRRVLDLTGAPDSLVRPVDDRPGHDRRYSLDSSKALQELGWEPVLRARDGPRPRPSPWYRDHRGWWEEIKRSRGYRDYYGRQYGDRLAG